MDGVANEGVDIFVCNGSNARKEILHSMPSMLEECDVGIQIRPALTKCKFM